MELKGLKKFKWLYLWIVGAALAVFSVVMFLNPEFGNSIVFYLSGTLLIIFVIIRFVPLINTTRGKWAIVVNAIEMFVNFVVGVLIIILTARVEDTKFLYSLFPFLLGIILYARGVIYLVEVVFLKTNAEKGKFLLSLILITVASVIIGRYDNFSVDSMRWVLLLAFGLCSLVSIVGGIKNYNNYRKSFVKLEKKEEKEVKDSNSIEAPGVETAIIIDENSNEKPQNYVS